ncbi:MAG: M43 family zinc metalloprotease [Aureispira sp.]
MLKIYFLLAIVLLLSTIGTAQQCATTQKEQQALQDPKVARQRARIQAKITTNISQTFTSNNIYTIPVVVHVLYNSPAQNISRQRIDEQIQSLNQDFRRQNLDGQYTPISFLPIAADTEIQFCLATRDPNGLPTTGITRRATTIANIGNGNAYYNNSTGGQTAWDPNRYLNIWVCEISSGTLGFTYRPGTAPIGADGVVIHYSNFGKTGATAPFDRGRTTTHEVGHWLDLDHLWGTGGCGQDDGVGDTPNQDQGSSGCPTHPRHSCGSPDMFMNYMDYTDDACMNMFTQGQRARMRATIQSVRPNLLLGQACVTVNNDAGMQITVPNSLVCTDSLRAEVLLYNYGTNTLQSAQIYYQLDNGTVGTINWIGTLNPTQSVRLYLPPLLLSNSPVHRLRVWSEQPNQQVDPFVANDTSFTSFLTLQAQLLPLTEGFQQTAGIPSGWQVDNFDNGITWAHTTQVGQSSSACFFMDNWDYQNQVGAVDRLVTPAVTLPNNTIPLLRFNVAYAVFSAASYGDTLRVQASNNCGQTWTTVYEKGGRNLTTVTGTRTTEFVPQSNEWRQEIVDLSAYRGIEALRLRFEHISEAENNLYLDNINISLLNNTKTVAKPSFLARLWPNPSQGPIQLELSLPVAGKVLVWRLYNALGQPLLEQKEVAQHQSRYQLSLEQLPKGVYFLEIQWDGQRQIKQILHQ